MKPLTIEELRSLEVGNWVWEDKSKVYEFIKDNTDEFVLVLCDGILDRHYYADYGTNWLAYKNKEQAEAKGEIVECKAGDKVWVIDYDEDVVNYVCIGCNKNFLFLSPTICAQEDFTTPDEICGYYADCYMEDERDTYIMVFPRNKCYKTKPEAEHRLKELQGE